MEGLVMGTFTGKNVLVTGATGLVGGAYTEKLLSEGANVFALIADIPANCELKRSGNLEKVTQIYGDLSNREVVARAITAYEIEAIFHFGAQTIVGTALLDPIGTFQSNIQGTWNILEASRNSKGLVRCIVVASSDKAYGESSVLPYLEDFPLHGKSPYDVSKSCTDLLAQSYARTYNMPIGIARCGNIYGPGDLNWSRIVPSTIKSITLGQQPVLRSDGKNLRDYVYIKDVVSAYHTLGSSIFNGDIESGEFNFSVDSPKSVLEIYYAVCNAVGVKVEPLILNSAQAEIKDQFLSSRKANQILNWSAKYDLELGLNETVPWYQRVIREGRGL
jgi:CDP-glucose 4,6-dehydratase